MVDINIVSDINTDNTLKSEHALQLHYSLQPWSPAIYIPILTAQYKKPYHRKRQNKLQANNSITTKRMNKCPTTLHPSFISTTRYTRESIVILGITKLYFIIVF